MVNNNLEKLSKQKTALLISAFMLFGATATHAQTGKGPAKADTFKLVNELINKKKFRKANKMLKAYSAAHPKDVNGVWKHAQTRLYSNDYRKSYDLYQAAMQMQPENDYLKLNYIHSLADMGKTEAAGNALHVMEQAGRDYSDMALLRARLAYYNGDHKQAAAYMKKAQQYDNKTPELAELNDQIAAARAPRVFLGSSYLSDNQPLKVLTSTIKAEQHFGRLLNLYVEGTEYHFMQTATSDAPWLRIGDKMFFPKAGLHVHINAGVFRFPVMKEVGWSGELSLNKKISQQFDIEVTGDRVPYFGTSASVDTNISAGRLSAMLNWHKSNWQGQAAFMNSTYRDGNNVYAAYAYLLVPVVTFQTGKLQMGASTSYSNSTDNRFIPANSLGNILANYNPKVPIAGVFDPYFTPMDMVANSALLAFGVDLSKRVSLNVNGDIGYASIRNPYLYLNKDNTGATVIAKDYSTEYFTPYSTSVALNYQASKTWHLSAKYAYRSTYFFNSNVVSVGIEKSFRKREQTARKAETKSAFMKSIMEVEDKIQALYLAKNRNELKQSVSKITNRLLAIRDEQQRKTNIERSSAEETSRIKERCAAINEMVADLNAVSLDDEEEHISKAKWLVEKLYELTSVHYTGPDEDEL